MDVIKDLKSQAYDAIVQVENWQKRLAEINQQISIEQKKEQETDAQDKSAAKEEEN